MSPLRLFIISPLGWCTEIVSGDKAQILIETGKELLMENPGIHVGVADEQGYFVWPDELKTINKLEKEVFDINPIESKGSALPFSCVECSVENCRLPFSKVLPNRKISDFTYKRHPKCQLTVNSSVSAGKK